MASHVSTFKARYHVRMTTRKIESLIVIGAAVWVFAGGSPAWSQQGAAPHELTAFLEESCYLCHGPLIQTAGINLSVLVSQRPLVKNRDTWKRVMGALEVGKMPPPGAAINRVIQNWPLESSNHPAPSEYLISKSIP